jgi:hypothetical protein
MKREQSFEVAAPLEREWAAMTAVTPGHPSLASTT